MSKIFLLIALPFLTFSFAFSQTQNPLWNYYFNGNYVTCAISFSNNSTVLIGTHQSGMALFDINTMAYQGFLNKATVPSIPTNNIRQIRNKGNDTAWICTDKGLMRLTTNSLTVYDMSNSGLPSNVINDIAFDVLGGKWIATDAGLAYNTGGTWTVYTTLNSPLPSDELNFVKIDVLGNIWVGTPNGLAMFDRNDWYVWNTQNSSLPDDFITFIDFEQNGNKWIGTLRGGLVNWVGNNMFIYDTTNSQLPSNTVLSFAFDTARTKWVGTSSGLVHIGGSGGWEVFTTSNSKLSNNYINSIYINSDDKKFISTRDSLTIIIDTNFYTINVAVSDLPTNYVIKVIEQNNLIKWIATPAGLLSYDGKQWEIYNTQNSILRSNNISDLAFDKNGTLWVATDSGLYSWNASQWTSYMQDSAGLPSNNVFNILPNGSWLWVGTDSGLAKLDLNTNQWTRFDTLFNGLLRNRISALAFDTSGNLYIGLETLGLAILKPDTLIHYRADNSPLANFFISSLFVDDDQSLLIGTFGLGVVKLDSNWTIINPDNSNFPDYSVKYITKSSDGWYWIATGRKGIAVFKDTSWIYINEDNSPLASNFINSIYFDFSNNKWLSTSNGLYVFNPDTLKPEIRIKPFNASLCMGDNLLVRYYTFWKFNNGNEFQVLLSDSAGIFSNPIIIGRFVANEAQPILGKIPKNILSSDYYRIKIVSTNPPLDGQDNGSDISIHTILKPKIYGDTIACSKSIQTFWTDQIPMVVHSWRVEGGTILSSNFGDTIIVQWDSVVGNKVILIATNQYNCTDSAVINVNISSLPGKIVYGSTNSCVGDSYIYSTTDSTNITNIWAVSKGTLIKKFSNYSVVIRWDSVGVGIIHLRRVNQWGCTDTVQLRVNIFRTPTATISGQTESMINSVVIYRTNRDFPGISLKWRVSGGSIIGDDSGDSVIIGWTKAGYGKVMVNQTSVNGCFDSIVYKVRIFEYSSIVGDTLVCEQNQTYFETLSNLGAINQWTVSGGTFTSSPQNRRVWIKWGNPGFGQIKLVQTYPGTNFRDSAIKTIIISAVPPKPIIADSGDHLISSAQYGNQWFWNGKPLIGDTNQVIFPLRTGYYSVQVKTAPGCVSEMSEPMYFVSGVEETLQMTTIRPNPTSGEIYLDVLNNLPLTRVSVLDAYGRKVKEIVRFETEATIKLNLDDLSNGIYIIQIESSKIVERAKIVLIK